MNSLLKYPGHWRRFTAIFAKEVKQLRRDRISFGMIVGVPLLQILLFGYAIDMDVRHLTAGVADQTNTALSRETIETMQASQVVDIQKRYAGPEQMRAALDKGAISVGIFLPPDFNERLLRGETAGQLLINGSDPTIEGIARQLARMPRPGASETAAMFETRTFYNPERRSEVQIVPALIGVILNLTMVLFTAIAIVRERERGNLELLIATPVSTGELMLGKITPYVVIGLIQVTIILVIGATLFAVPINGSLAELYLGSMLFILATLALGLLISTLAATQFQAMQLTVFTFLPSILLSGFMFPFEGMPQAARWLAEILPLTHFVRILRGIVLRGAHLTDMPEDILALAGFFAVMMLLTRLRFRKRLD